MKTFNTYIQEKLIIKKDKKSSCTLFPKTKEELIEMIKSEIGKKGKKCSLNHIDVSKITDMEDLFASYYGGNKLDEFNGDISEWDVSNVTNMKGMFHGSKFTGERSNLSNWDVSSVIDMSGMFAYTKPSSIDFSSWDVLNVENMNSMFYRAKYFSGLGVVDWDVSNVKDMTYMFIECRQFCSSLSKWNLVKLQKCEGMFSYCTNLCKDFSSWDVTNVNHKEMFKYCPINKRKEYWPKGYTK